MVSEWRGVVSVFITKFEFVTEFCACKKDTGGVNGTGFCVPNFMVSYLLLQVSKFKLKFEISLSEVVRTKAIKIKLVFGK